MSDAEYRGLNRNAAALADIAESRDERIANLERQLAEAQGWEEERDAYIESYDEMCKEHDRYKAQAERRKKALWLASWRGIDGEVHWGSKLTDDHTESMCKSLCVPNRAAIEEGEK